MVALGLSLNYGLDGGIEQSFYGEASVGYETELAEDLSLEVGAAVGYLSPDEGEDGFSHFTASAELGWSLLSLGVTYVGQIDDDVLPDYAAATAATATAEAIDAVLGYDAEVVGTIGVGASF